MSKKEDRGVPLPCDLSAPAMYWGVSSFGLSRQRKSLFRAPASLEENAPYFAMANARSGRTTYAQSAMLSQLWAISPRRPHSQARRTNTLIAVGLFCEGLTGAQSPSLSQSSRSQPHTRMRWTRYLDEMASYILRRLPANTTDASEADDVGGH